MIYVILLFIYTTKYNIQSSNCSQRERERERLELNAADRARCRIRLDLVLDELEASFFGEKV